MSKNFKRKTRNNYIVPKIQLFFSSEKKYDFEIFKRGKIQKSRLTFLLCFCQFEFLDKKWTFGTLCCEKGWKNCSAWLKYFCILIVLTWFLMYHLAFLPLCDNLAEKVTSSRDPCLIFLSTGSSIHSNFSCKLSNTVRKS